MDFGGEIQLVFKGLVFEVLEMTLCVYQGLSHLISNVLQSVGMNETIISCI